MTKFNYYDHQTFLKYTQLEVIMLYTKDGYPDSNEIVLCEVTKIYGNTTFVKLKEYDKEGVLTISEIAPGRIRNLRDHVKEGKTIICKVLRVDEKNNRVDVSLRRVPIPVMKDKLEEIKKEDYAERVYHDVGKELGITKDDLFEKTYEVIFENYETVFEALYEIMLDNKKIDIFDQLSSKEKEIFVKGINDKIKPEEVNYRTKFTLRSFDSQGVLKIKESISKAVESVNYDKIKVYYLAAGTFSVNIAHEDMKSASKVFNSFKESLTKESKSNNLRLEITE